MNPKIARLRFRLRTIENFGIVFTVFVVLAVFISPFPFAWVADFILIGTLYFLFFHVLNHRAIGVDCPHCGKHIKTNSPWICGFCKRTNENGDDFPFINKCKHCKAEPRAYRCHHRECGKLIFLGDDELEANFASCPNTTVIEDSEVEEDETERFEKQKRAIENELIITELSAKLNAAKQRVELEKKRSPKERLEKSFEDHHATTMGAREIAEAQKKEIKKKYRGDRKMQQAAAEAIDDWLRTQI